MDQHMDPPQDTPQESIFSEEDFSMKDYDKHIKNARVMLFIIAAIQLISGFIVSRNLEGETFGIAMGIYGVFALIFAGLALWTKKKPVPALWISLIFYIVLVVVYAILDPTTIYKGVVIKAVTIVLLVRGLQNARQAQELMQAFGKNA